MTDEIRDWNRRVIDEFRANGGRVGGMFEGRDVVLLHNVGAKSGEPRVNPLVFIRDGDRIVIAASYGGGDRNPAWFHNIVANPKVTLEVGEETFDATATVVTDRAERDRLYAGMVAAHPNFAGYEKKTDRLIPVIVLER